MILWLLVPLALAGPWGQAKKACRSGDADACAEAARALSESGDARSVDLLRGACGAGAMGACGMIARWSLRGGGPVPLEPGDARGPLDTLCAGGRRDACADLGWVLEHGHGGDPDPEAAANAYGRACRAGAVAGCQALKAMGVPVGTSGRTNACASGDGAACVDLVAEWSSDARAADLELPLRAGCDVGSADACGLLGRLLVRGHGIAADGARGRSLLERACTLGGAGSCVGAADLWLTGMVDDEKDEERAHQLLHRACTLGDARACARDHDHGHDHEDADEAPQGH